MAKKRKNHEKDFVIRKADRKGQFHKIFSEFIVLPFNLFIDIYKNNPIVSDSYSSYVRYLIWIPEETGNHLDINLIEKIVKILNNEEIEIKLKNVKFNHKDIDGRYIYLNENIFLEVIDLYGLKKFMQNAGYSGYRTPLTIRRSLMHYITNSLNNSLTKK